jgi:hypothetical protein
LPRLAAWSWQVNIFDTLGEGPDFRTWPDPDALTAGLAGPLIEVDLSLSTVFDGIRRIF